MKYISIEHSRLGYWFDFGAYALVLAVFLVLLVSEAPEVEWARLLMLFGLGMACWTLLEYLIHRFVLHGIKPFSDWHAEHHERPMAFIGAPIWLTVGLFIALIFLPVLTWFDVKFASAITLGAATGYLYYCVVHHATHHWRTRRSWLRDRKRWHARHHYACGGQNFGVTTSFWDRIFRTCKTGTGSGIRIPK